MRATTSPFVRDLLFWLALSAAPLCWFMLAQCGVARRDTPLAPMPVLMVVLVSPVLEELVFRAGLQDWLLTRRALQRSFAGISAANVLTSVAFAAMHLLRQPPVWAAMIFIPSLVFGWARQRHQSLLSPVVLHMVYNAGFVWMFG